MRHHQSYRSRITKWYSRKKRNGFTLVELLVVIAIIGTLSSFMFANFIGARQKSRDGQRKTDLNQIASALESYRGDTDTYPTLSGSFTLVPCNQPFTSSDKSIIYVQKMPCDPLQTSQTFNNGNYVYVSSSGSDYSLITCLENTNDKNGINASQLPSGSPNPSGCSSGTFYEITDGTLVSSNGSTSPTSTPQQPTLISTDTPTLILTNTPTPTPLPITHDADSSSDTNGATTLTWTHTTANSANFLLVGITTQGTIDSVTYKGAKLTQIGPTVNLYTGPVTESLWYLLNPSIGSNTIAITLTGSAQPIFAGASTYENVDSGNPLGTIATNSGFGPYTASVNLNNTISKQIIVDTLGYSWTPTPNASQVPTWKSPELAGYGSAGSYKNGTDGNTTMTWNFPQPEVIWAQIAVPLNQAK